MEERVSTSISPRRFNALLLAMFAGLALMLAAVGIYGVIAFSVAQRTHEIGVRMALGAQAGQLLWLVIGEGMSLALVGIVIGVAGALGVMRFIRSFLFHVSATDPVTFTAVALLLTVVAFLACYIPARHAMRVDPMVALRYQ
jgi:putative ABC transport system permease protein